VPLFGPLVEKNGSVARSATWVGMPSPSSMLDRTHLEMALLNVLINARDAMPEGGPVTIVTEAVEIGKPCTIASPSPVPLFGPLVEKNGSVARSATWVGMPAAIPRAADDREPAGRRYHGLDAVSGRLRRGRRVGGAGLDHPQGLVAVAGHEDSVAEALEVVAGQRPHVVAVLGECTASCSNPSGG
jgi:hypothetical protein